MDSSEAFDLLQEAIRLAQDRTGGTVAVSLCLYECGWQGESSGLERGRRVETGHFPDLQTAAWMLAALMIDHFGGITRPWRWYSCWSGDCGGIALSEGLDYPRFANGAVTMENLRCEYLIRATAWEEACSLHGDRMKEQSHEL